MIFLTICGLTMLVCIGWCAYMLKALGLPLPWKEQPNNLDAIFGKMHR